MFARVCSLCDETGCPRVLLLEHVECTGALGFMLSRVWAPDFVLLCHWGRKIFAPHGRSYNMIQQGSRSSAFEGSACVYALAVKRLA